MTTRADVLDIDPLDLVSPSRFGSSGYPHETWTRLRRHDPVHWCEPEGYRPFWAITKHEDIKAISTQPERFVSAPRWVLMHEKVEQRTYEMYPGSEERGGTPFRSLVNMDPPDHRTYRDLTAPFFKPRTLRALEDRMREVTRMLLDHHAGKDVELDFVDDIAQWHPLRMILEILGLAASDEALILKLTGEVFAGEDEEFVRSDNAELWRDLFSLFKGVIETKRGGPGDDLASVLSTAKIDGQLVPELELIGYFILVATAGHHTTRGALAGGMNGLIGNQDQLERLRSHPALAKPATEEILRWASPIVHFMRTATEDTGVRDKTIRSGESLALFYPSANRDEEVFDDPFSFRVDRDPNLHVAFGVGEHFCLGAPLARMEIKVMLEELVPRLTKVESTGEPEWVAAGFVGGIKHLPLRWSLR